MPKCECGRTVEELFDDDLRAVDDGRCVDCVIRGNSEHMGTFRSAGERRTE